MAIDKFKGMEGHGAATYDMWLFEYERLNDVLRACTDFFLQVRGNPDLLPLLFTVLNEFYRIVRPLLQPQERINMDGKRNALKELVFVEHNAITSARALGMSRDLDEHVLEELDVFYNYLMDLRQQKGMGVKYSRKVSDKEKIDNVVGGQE